MRGTVTQMVGGVRGFVGGRGRWRGAVPRDRAVASKWPERRMGADLGALQRRCGAVRPGHDRNLAHDPAPAPAVRVHRPADHAADAADVTAAAARPPAPPPIYEIADLVVTKQASPVVAIQGHTVTYTIKVRNLGPDPAAAVALTVSRARAGWSPPCTTRTVPARSRRRSSVGSAISSRAARPSSPFSSSRRGSDTSRTAWWSGPRPAKAR